MPPQNSSSARMAVSSPNWWYMVTESPYLQAGGGLDLGIRIAGAETRTVCYVEWEAYPLSILVTAMEEGFMDKAPVWDDLRTFDGRRWRGAVDWVVGGIPCQPHSTAGHRLGADDERDLWPSVERIIGEIRPAVVFLENVPGILWYYHDRIGPGLRDTGYRTKEGLFSAREVGAPHFRQRFFALGYTDHESLSVSEWGLDGNLLPASERDQSEIQSGPSSVGVEGAGSFRRKAGKSEQARQPVSGRIRKGVSYSDRRQRQELGRPEQEESEQGLFPLFPPKPNRLDAWAYLLEVILSLEPAFCNVAHGVAGELDHTAARSHQLQTLGNGVVPLVAAHALRTLASRIHT